jgi:hypothetical protein
VKLPEDDEDGSLPREQVFQVLKLSHVQVEHLADLERPGEYRTLLLKDHIVEFQSFDDLVPRETIRYLARKFGIEMLAFYYPQYRLMH